MPCCSPTVRAHVQCPNAGPQQHLYNGVSLMRRTNTWVDIISLIPALLHVFETMGALQIEKDSAYHGLLNLMRLLRVGRLMRTYRLISYTGVPVLAAIAVWGRGLC